MVDYRTGPSTYVHGDISLWCEDDQENEAPVGKKRKKGKDDGCSTKRQKREEEMDNVVARINMGNVSHYHSIISGAGPF